MISEIDIYRSAKAMIDRHGHSAAIEAAMRVDKLLVEGDFDGQRVWLRILRAIDDLSAPLENAGLTKDNKIKTHDALN